MEIRPGLDLSAAWKTHRKVRPQATAIVNRMRDLTEGIMLAPAADLIKTAEAKGLHSKREAKTGMLAVSFTGNDLMDLSGDRMLASAGHTARQNPDRPIVIGRVKDEFGPTISLDFHLPMLRMIPGISERNYRGAGVIDRAVAADLFDDALDVSYLINLVYEGFTPRSNDLTEICGFAFVELASWQVHNDLLAMARELESDRKTARISVAIDGDEFLPTAVIREMNLAVRSIFENWDEAVPTRRGLVRPGRLYAFDTEVDLSDGGDHEPS